MLTAVLHISDIKFLHDNDTDGVYIENEELLEISKSNTKIDPLTLVVLIQIILNHLKFFIP